MAGSNTILSIVKLLNPLSTKRGGNFENKSEKKGTKLLNSEDDRPLHNANNPKNKSKLFLYTVVAKNTAVFVA